MLVWGGCRTCREDPEGHKWIGRWMTPQEFLGLLPEDIHPVRSTMPEDVREHELYPYTLDDWIPANMSEEDVRYFADYAEHLETLGLLEPFASFAAAMGQSLLTVRFHDFWKRYAGQWAGKPTRAARKRYIFLPAGPGHYYLIRRSVPRSEAVRRAVQV